jgi:hypothetical protein
MTDRPDKVPPVAAALAAAGLLPFLWGAATLLRPALGTAAAGVLPANLTGAEVLLRYGVVILCFMSGVFWGLAARAGGSAAAALYAMSVIPALYIFFNIGTTPQGTALSLVIGFAGILAIDRHVWQAGMAPVWWMRLRLPVTAVVLVTLVPVMLT